MLFEQFNGLFEAQSEESWTKSVFSLARNLGFDQTLFAVLKSKNEPIENAFLRSNYAGKWRSTYDSERLGYVDPTVTHCLSSTIPLLWTPECFIKPAQKNMYEEASSYGLRSGIILPIHGPDGEFGMISFVSEDLANKKSQNDISQYLPTLSIMRDYVFETSKGFSFTGARRQREVSLTPREREVLTWSMVGKTSWETSIILNCSESTINFHLGNIRQKFGVNTKQQAIIKGLKLGLIQL